MKKEKMGKMLAKGVAAVAKEVTRSNVNTACSFIIYQPKLPKAAEKLKK